MMDVIAGGADVLMRAHATGISADPNANAIVAAVDVEVGSAPGH